MGDCNFIFKYTALRDLSTDELYNLIDKPIEKLNVFKKKIVAIIKDVDLDKLLIHLLKVKEDFKKIHINNYFQSSS